MVKTLKDLRLFGKKELAGFCENPSLEASILLCSLGFTKEALIINETMEVSPIKAASFENMLKRRKSGEPIAYIIGEKEFMGLSFSVNKNVLIPRPETELLVSEILSFLNGKKANVLDLCTGSGCIGLSLCKYNENILATLVDISKNALDTARENAEKHNLSNRVLFEKTDVLKGEIKDISKFDIIVSNPPYIEKSTINLLEKDVKDFEPILALAGGEDGLDFYRALQSIVKKAKKGAAIFLEIGYNQRESVKSILSHYCENIEIKKDLAGQDRVVTAKCRGLTFGN